MLESSIGSHTAAHLATGTGALDYVGLDGNFSLEIDFSPVMYGPEIDINSLGHGVGIVS